MDKIVREQDEDRERILEEKRNRTPAERMKLLQERLASLGPSELEELEPREEHLMPYHEIQRRMLERNRKQ